MSHASPAFLTCFVFPQRGSALCGPCHYEDVLKWTTGSSLGFICFRTRWRNWTSLTVHASLQAAWLHSGISSNCPNTHSIVLVVFPNTHSFIDFLSFCVCGVCDVCACVAEDYGIWTCHPFHRFQVLDWSLFCWRRCYLSARSSLLAMTLAWGRREERGARSRCRGRGKAWKRMGNRGFQKKKEPSERALLWVHFSLTERMLIEQRFMLRRHLTWKETSEGNKTYFYSSSATAAFFRIGSNPTCCTSIDFWLKNISDANAAILLWTELCYLKFAGLFCFVI